jgi:hypothetical protein
VDVDLPQLGKRALRIHATRIAFGSKAVAGEEELTVLTFQDVTTAEA